MLDHSTSFIGSANGSEAHQGVVRACRFRDMLWWPQYSETGSEKIRGKGGRECKAQMLTMGSRRAGGGQLGHRCGVRGAGWGGGP